MNTRQKAILLAGVLVASATLSAQAADQSDYFEQQRQITDGYYPQYSVQPTPARAKPATEHQAAEDAWFDAERTRGSSRSLAEIPFPVPATVNAAPREQPETAYQAAENRWLTQERNETDGNVAPVQFTR